MRCVILIVNMLQYSSTRVTAPAIGRVTDDATWLCNFYPALPKCTHEVNNNGQDNSRANDTVSAWLAMCFQMSCSSGKSLVAASVRCCGCACRGVDPQGDDVLKEQLHSLICFAQLVQAKSLNPTTCQHRRARRRIFMLVPTSIGGGKRPWSTK